MDIKKYVHKKIKEMKKTQKENKKFSDSLKEEELKIRRDAYRKESLRQAKIDGKLLAKKKQSIVNNESFNKKLKKKKPFNPFEIQERWNVGGF